MDIETHIELVRRLISFPPVVLREPERSVLGFSYVANFHDVRF